MTQKTLGGERLGSGNRMKVELHNYERSTHDLSHIIRTTMSPGTLVPFLKKVALPGDTWDIELNADVLTSPTIGPLFGTFKLQLDVFIAPFRLYQSMLHMNMLGIGLDMSKVYLPSMQVETLNLKQVNINNAAPDNMQINPSSLLKYLGISGNGSSAAANNYTYRKYNAIPLLAYWDIYKNYYANKQEGIGVFIHRPSAAQNITLSGAGYKRNTLSSNVVIPTSGPDSWTSRPLDQTGFISITATTMPSDTYPTQFYLRFNEPDGVIQEKLSELFDSYSIDPVTKQITFSNPTERAYHPVTGLFNLYDCSYVEFIADNPNTGVQPQLVTFPLTNIDNMRTTILQAPQNTQFNITYASPDIVPYKSILSRDTTTNLTSSLYPQEGLAIKTYQSDIFNNWLNTEWITGTNGIAEITAVQISNSEFKIDELIMNRKIYEMLNRIAVSGGTYDDWLDAVYTHERNRSVESPMYMGGLIKNIVFQEVVGTAETENQPLGTLAGRGKLGQTHKGGKIIIKVDEPSYIMGIVSITPIIDYSQGNEWDMNLMNMDQLHKPGLDQIGFQDLITDQMAWWDTRNTSGSSYTFKSAGKQPAWVNYMTAYNKALGNFAIQNEQMFMTLNRRYEMKWLSSGNEMAIKDLTTYIDPSKFNQIFADTRLDAMNFWVQIGMDITTRRKMSAKVMPNL